MGFNPLSHFARRLRRLEKLHNARVWNFRLHYLVKYEFFTRRFFLGGTEPLDDANHVGLFQQFGNGRLFILRRSLLELADRKAPSLSPEFPEEKPGCAKRSRACCHGCHRDNRLTTERRGRKSHRRPKYRSRRKFERQRPPNVFALTHAIGCNGKSFPAG